MRIAYRWQAIEQENNEIELSKELGEVYHPNRLSNGDTHKQLLFKYYPQLEQAYALAQKLGHIYHQVKDKGVAFTKLAQWYNLLRIQLSKALTPSPNQSKGITLLSSITLKDALRMRAQNLSMPR